MTINHLYCCILLVFFPQAYGCSVKQLKSGSSKIPQSLLLALATPHSHYSLTGLPSSVSQFLFLASNLLSLSKTAVTILPTSSPNVSLMDPHRQNFMTDRPEPPAAESNNCCRLRLKCDGTRAETRFRLSAKRTSPFKLAGGRQFSRLLVAEVCASAVIMLDTPCAEVV